MAKKNNEEKKVQEDKDPNDSISKIDGNLRDVVRIRKDNSVFGDDDMKELLHDLVSYTRKDAKIKTDDNQHFFILYEVI